MKLVESNGKKYFSGKLDYVKQYPDEISMNEVEIGEVISLSETGFYIDWGISNCGYGQYSMSYKDGKWSIMNECMGINSCSLILETLEEGLLTLGNPKINYILSKLKYNMSIECRNLKQGLTLIWENADKEGSNRDKKEKDFTSIKLNDLTINDIYFEEEVVELRKLRSKPNEKKSMLNVKDLSIDFDYQFKQFGFLNIAQKTYEDGKVLYQITHGMEQNVLLDIFEKLEQLSLTETKNLELQYTTKQIESIEKIKLNWKQFKNIFLNLSIEEIVSTMFNEDTRVKEKIVYNKIR